ncbi:hypothetical protein NBO_760g0001 [Nosema bombycis CQ1]|uniref:Uncharacterized protein n=1 Tax=Nosema bombycis (strain CQ1 / CVCC 102059) TaxID=578461 RepID=R0KNT0_NOSB1|nr:hypothetical protein NBO_760g0001 [Nosema bombycis CQ1]|eukprot:EOB11827.1 hypothetical protein NBO_760g0001 [Nosema bombycis CQ1]
MNLGILQHTIIPNLCKVCNEINDNYTKIYEKIKEIKQSSRNYDPELINKIEQKNIVNIKVFNKNSAIIENIRLRTEKLILAFEKSVSEYREIKFISKPSALNVIYKIKYDLASEICKETNQSLENLKIVQDKFQSYKAQVESILVLLFKYLKMTPEAFKADEEVKKVLFFLN